LQFPCSTYFSSDNRTKLRNLPPHVGNALTALTVLCFHYTPFNFDKEVSYNCQLTAGSPKKDVPTCPGLRIFLRGMQWNDRASAHSNRLSIGNSEFRHCAALRMRSVSLHHITMQAKSLLARIDFISLARNWSNADYFFVVDFHNLLLLLLFIIYYLLLFRSARSIGLRQCLAIRGSCFSFLDPLDIW
jgi:hypothetical protein